MVCANHLKNLVLASHNFHDTRRRFPPGWLGTPDGTIDQFQPENYQNLGVNHYLSPYIEATPLYQYVPSDYMRTKILEPSMDSSSIRAWWREDLEYNRDGVSIEECRRLNLFPRDKADPVPPLALRSVSHFQFSISLCPSSSDECSEDVMLSVWFTREQNFVNQTNAFADEIDVYGYMEPRTNFFEDRVAVTHYSAVSGVAANYEGYNSTKKYNGAFGNRTRTKMEDVTDGLSNTLAFGESPFVLNQHRATKHTLSWFGCGAIGTAYGVENKPNFTKAKSPRSSFVPHFSSRHPGVIFFANLDGSTSPIDKNVDLSVLYTLSGIADQN